MPLKVVFVDDEVDLIDVYKELFEMEEVELNCFTDSDEALSFLNSHDVDLCFLDYRMPKISGIELREKIERPVVSYLLTGELDTPLIEGFEAVLNKPMGLEKFSEIVKNHLK